ncbi:MAG: autotransporter domain-containing protein [Chromatiales bacterium]|nr:autotransporter domain-containing protein [Chromatiales bacterium]
MRRPSLNHCYRLVWDRCRQCWLATAEITKGRGKSSARLKPLAAIICTSMGLLTQAPLQAADLCPGPGTNTISTAVTGGGGDACYISAGENLTVEAGGSLVLPGRALDVDSATSGFINNSGLIDGNGNSSIFVGPGSTLTGGLVNSGTIEGEWNSIQIRNAGVDNGIANSGTIHAVNFHGIAMDMNASIDGGISNTGTISAANGDGIQVGVYDPFDPFFSSGATINGGIVNGTGGTISGSDHGILVQYNTSAITGGIVNRGTIEGGSYAIYVADDAALDAITIEGNDTARFDLNVHAINTPVTVANGATFTLIDGNHFEVQGFTNNGTLKIDAGSAATITGNFTNNGTFRTQVSDTQAGTLTVNGNATLGGSLSVDASTLTAGHSWAGNRISIINATSLSGTFASYSDNSLLFDFTPEYFADRLDIVFTASGGGSGGGGTTVLDAVESTGNTPATGAATVFDDLIADFSGGGTTGNAGMDAVITTFAGFTTEQETSNAVSQTLPLLTGANPMAASAALGNISGIVQARQAQNSGLSAGDDFHGDRKVWLKPFGSWADQGDRNGAAGYEARPGGLVFGADATVSDSTRLGVSLAYARTNVEGNADAAPSESDIDIYQLIGYGSYALTPDAELNFQIGIGQNKNEGLRGLPTFGLTASSDYTSDVVTAGIGYGRSIRLDEDTRFIPSTRANYTWIRDEDYTETGAGALNLSVDSRTTDELIVSADGKIVHDLKPDTAVTANLGLGYDLLSEQTSVTSAFAGAPTATFTTEGLDPSPWLARGGLGLIRSTASGLEVTARYDAEYRADFLNQTANIKLRWAF